MPKQIIIAEQHRIAAVFSEDQIQELIVATGSHQISDIYLGVVENVLPGIDAAFVNIGDSERNGFIHVTDLGPLRLKRSAGSITELLSPQQKVLVQVMKEPTGNKGPRLTGKITLPGRYLVLMPYGKGVNLSRHIRNENERNRLRALAILVKPAGMGMIVRTEAEGVPEEAIIEDLEALQKQWETIQQEAVSTRAPALLNRDDDFIQRVLRDMYNADVNRIVVDSHTGLKRVKQHLTTWSGGKSPQGVSIDHHRERTPILEYFRVNAAIREALKPRVDLPSGGYIIIQPTEALTVIDVNSGSFTRSATARETVLWTNCEAATEIARQLRLRNIAGVIIVDFIDMDSRRDQLQVLEQFNKDLKTDKSRPQIAQLSELGLVELTRKRQGQNIYELFGRACPTCGGLGHLIHLPGETELSDEEILERANGSLAREAIVDSRSTNTRARVESGSYDGGYRRNRPGPDTHAHSHRPTRGRIQNTPVSEPPPARDPGYPPETGQPSFPWDTEDEGDFGTGNDDDIDLLNHPSYQERGGGNRRRRRRRVGGEGGRGPGDSRSELPMLNKRGRPGEAPEERSGATIARDTIGAGTGPATREPGNGRRIASRLDPVIEVEESTPIEEAAPAAKENWGRGDRNKSRREAKPATPPETVVVEMTPEEQDVYSVMGISPLVLANREVKDPRSAVISVVLPGEAPPESLTAEVSVPLEAPADEPEAPTEVAPPEPEPIAQVVEVEPTVVAVAVAEPPAEEPNAEAESSGVVRRRRRRSSASESGE